MDLLSLLGVLRGQAGYSSLLRQIAAGEPLPPSVRLPRSARPAFAAALAFDLRRVVLCLVARPDRMQVLAEEIPIWAPDLPLLTFPSPVPLFYETTTWGPRTIADRVRVLARLAALRDAGAEQGPLLVLAAARGAMTRTLPPSVFEAHSR